MKHGGPRKVGFSGLRTVMSEWTEIGGAECTEDWDG